MQYDQFFAGEYQVEETLERAQYYVLCRGKEVATGRKVLLKLWLTAQVTSDEAQTQVREEVHALQRARHPYLLPVLDWRADEQKVFLVSEYAPHSLNEHLGGEEAFSLEKTLQLIEQVGQALQELHNLGIIHGNLTPQAVFLDAFEQVRVSEFLMRSVLTSIPDYQHMLDEQVPRCLYMAPEQFSGVLDAKTDQYALGCLSYVLLTGRVPFAGSARATLLQKHQRETPQDLTALNPAVPVHVEEAVLKSLARQPEERYTSIEAFLNALDIPGTKGMADLATMKQPVATVATGQTTAVWEWEVAAPPEDLDIPGTKGMADLATMKQPVATVATGHTTAVWEREVAAPPEDEEPVQTVSPARRSNRHPVRALVPANQPRSLQLTQSTRKREWYVIVPILCLVMLFFWEWVAGSFFLVVVTRLRFAQ